jgi:outer membrane protein
MMTSTTKQLLCLFLTVLAFPVHAWSQQDSPTGEVLTLEQAIALALSQNHSVRDAELESRKTENRVAAAKSNRLPSMNLYSLTAEQFLKQDITQPGTISNILPGVGPFFSIGVPRRPTFVAAGLILQPLSQQYRLGLNVKQIKLAGDTQTEELRRVKQSTVDRVKQTYYGILQTQSALVSIQEAIASYRELDRYTGDQVAQEVSLKSANLDVKTRLAKAEYDALNLTNESFTQKEQLNNLLGRDVRTEFRLSSAPGVSGFPADLESARNRALQQRPEVREARLQISQAEVERRIKKSEYIPDVTAGFGYMTLRNFDDFIPKNIAIAGVAVQWEVFDWGRKREQLAEKDKVIEQAQERLRDAQNQVLVDVGEKFRQLQLTRQSFVVAQLAVETAREALRVNTNRYKLTAALMSDVLQSQSTLAETNHQFQQAVLGYWTAQAEFEKALGKEQ